MSIKNIMYELEENLEGISFTRVEQEIMKIIRMNKDNLNINTY